MKNIRYVVNHLVSDPSKIGCAYMATATKIIVLRGEFPHKKLSNDLYPAVAAKHIATPGAVSRAIDRVVEDCWDNGDRAYLEKVAGHEVKRKPDPSQLLAWIVDYITGEEG